MNMKSISQKILACLIPLILISMLILSGVSISTSKTIMDAQVQDTMTSELNAQMNLTTQYLSEVITSAVVISRMVGNSYQTTKMDTYLAVLEDIIKDNNIVLGSGIWFEPNVYEPNEEYVGPYVYKDGDSILTTYDYSNADYDYFKQEYYTLAKNSKTAIITDPYYDATTNTTMSTCTMPVFNEEDDFIGCVTVDIELTSIQNLIAAVQIGEQGRAELLTGTGVFIGSDDSKKVENAENILNDENTSLADAGSKILLNKNGTTTYRKDKNTYKLYYDTIDLTGWKLIISIPQSELNQDINRLTYQLIIICLVAVMVVNIVTILIITSISKKIKQVQLFAKELADGNYATKPLHIKTQDEVGQMSKALDLMYDSTKVIITNISTHASDIGTSSSNLLSSANALTCEFTNIEQYLAQVNEDMMSASAATEEVNASTEEVNASVNILANATSGSRKMAEEIKVRAKEIGANAKNSYNNATELSTSYEQRLQTSIENAKIVEDIEKLAAVISGIAEQINLLSLNASIEAARAGEQGKGFAVVAAEIGKLANETAMAVGQIQGTIQKVQEAFTGLTDESVSLLKFIQETVTPDYDKFVGIAEQYESDANSIQENASDIFDMSESVRNIMNEVSSAIQNVAESTQDTAENSAKVMEAANRISDVIEDVSGMATNETEISQKLNDVVNRFKI